MNTDGSWALPAFLGHVLAPPSRCHGGRASIGDTPASSPRLHSGAEGWAGGAGARGGMPAGQGGREGGREVVFKFPGGSNAPRGWQDRDGARGHRAAREQGGRSPAVHVLPVG